MAGHGPEKRHPNPEFFYKPGGGPMLDMGPYYITCLINLLGPIVRVSGAAATSFPERIDGKNRRISVEVPTHYTGTLEFASGAIATVIMSFDVWAHRLPNGMEVYGEEGTMTVPDPNGYKPREVKVYTAASGEWAEVPSQYPDEWARGIGLADMAYAIREGRPHRASGDLALHVLEVLQSFPIAQKAGSYLTLTTTCERPAALSPDFAKQVS
ncbi:MAG: Gfo/Idh/MocA family oxidoreductase [Anaerolineae bacterium]